MFPNNETTKRFIADHFRKRRTPLTEDAILEVIRTPRSKHDVYWGVLALRDVGTARAIPCSEKPALLSDAGREGLFSSDHRTHCWGGRN
jgi:hypothetical protein